MRPYGIKFLMFWALIPCFLCLAHDRSYEMTIDNFIKHYPEMHEREIELRAVYKERDTYSEIFLYSEDEDGNIIGKQCEFNNIYPTKKRLSPDHYYSDFYLTGKHYEITIFNWLNTVGLKSDNHEYIYHGKPSCLRWNDGFGEIDKEFFEDIIKTGKFDLYFENNHMFWNSEKSLHTGRCLITVKNPEEFKKFLKIPWDINLPYDLRKKIRIVGRKLSFWE